jgi:hypothetical protein
LGQSFFELAIRIRALDKLKAAADTGVYQTLETVQRRTAGNLTYIGEWHTHPPGHRSLPSADDRVLLRWIGKVLVYSDVPALMLIAGEDGTRVVMGPGGASVLLRLGAA